LRPPLRRNPHAYIQQHCCRVDRVNIVPGAGTVCKSGSPTDGDEWQMNVGAKRFVQSQAR
jgi:hypothetical protein